MTSGGRYHLGTGTPVDVTNHLQCKQHETTSFSEASKDHSFIALLSEYRTYPRSRTMMRNLLVILRRKAKQNNAFGFGLSADTYPLHLPMRGLLSTIIFSLIGILPAICSPMPAVLKLVENLLTIHEQDHTRLASIL